MKDAGNFACWSICDFVRNIRCLVDVLGVLVLILCKSIGCVFIGGGNAVLKNARFSLVSNILFLPLYIRIHVFRAVWS